MQWPDRPARSKLLTSFIAAEFARVDPSIATFLGVHNGLALSSIDMCASPEQKERWLPKMRSMELIGSFGLSEPHGGSDVAGGLETTARPRRRRVGAQRREALDRQCHVRGPEHHLGARRGG
jgi:glutaryl-CoA dehydrogenase